jgi:hypothetical protein
MTILNEMAERGIVLYSVGCEPSITPYKDFFACMAFKTGGQYVPLLDASLLAKIIVGGALEGKSNRQFLIMRIKLNIKCNFGEISLESLIDEAKIEVEQLRSEGITDEKKLTEAVQKKIKENGIICKNKSIVTIFLFFVIYFPITGIKTKQLFLNKSNLKNTNETVKSYAKLSKMSDVKSSFNPYEPPEEIKAMAKTETIEVVDSEINYEQAERLVQRALKRTDSKTGKGGAVKRGRNYVAHKNPKISSESIVIDENSSTLPSTAASSKDNSNINSSLNEDKPADQIIHEKTSTLGSISSFLFLKLLYFIE